MFTRSQQENDLVLSLLEGAGQEVTWLGAVFYGEASTFTWLDSSYVNYLNWAPGQVLAGIEL